MVLSNINDEHGIQTHDSDIVWKWSFLSIRSVFDPPETPEKDAFQKMIHLFVTHTGNNRTTINLAWDATAQIA